MEGMKNRDSRWNKDRMKGSGMGIGDTRDRNRVYREIGIENIWVRIGGMGEVGNW